MDATVGTRWLPNVGVPLSLVADPAAFGGERRGDLLCGHLALQGGRALRLDADEAAAPSQLVLPRLTEAHVHLDKAHTIERIPDVGGDLEAALAAQFRDKAIWTHDDLAQRMERGLDELHAAGVGTVRSHIDWGSSAENPGAPMAWEVLCDLAKVNAPRGLTVQCAALTGIDEMADPSAAEAVARRVADVGGVLGSFVKHHADRRPGLENLFDLATRFGLALDFHVDEGLDPRLDGVELIADIAIETGFEGSILCGHACTLATLPEQDVGRIADKLAQAGISVAALPTTNLYLQGRVPGGTPDRRGITRLHELRARGVNVVIGTDNVRDAFCPIGRHDPLYTLSIAVLAGHLDPPFAPHLATITSNARHALGLPRLTVDGAAVEELVVFDAPSLSGLIAAPARPHALADLLETAHAR